MKNQRRDDDFSYLVNSIQYEMEKSIPISRPEAFRKEVQFPEGALDHSQQEPKAPVIHGWSAGGVVGIRSGPERRRDARRGDLEAEREIQQSMAYGVAPGVHVGWWAYVFDGQNRWRWWRPTRRWADDVGRFVLRNEVRLRQRRWANQHPEMRNARDLWIVPPTDLESWIEAYKQAEGKQ